MILPSSTRHEFGKPVVLLTRNPSAMKMYIICYRFTRPGEKKPAFVTHYKIHANNREEALRLAAEALPEGVEIIQIKEA